MKTGLEKYLEWLETNGPQAHSASLEMAIDLLCEEKAQKPPAPAGLVEDLIGVLHKLHSCEIHDKEAIEEIKEHISRYTPTPSRTKELVRELVRMYDAIDVVLEKMRGEGPYTKPEAKGHYDGCHETYRFLQKEIADILSKFKEAS